jgi:hypothetical protein
MIFDGLHEMSTRGDDFERIVSLIALRFLQQTGRPAPAVEVLARFVAQLRQVVAERGLPAPLPEGVDGTPGGMSEAESAPLIARVMDGIGDAGLAEVSRQLVKACFYPEFKICRNSFQEVSRDGSCRRQEIDRVRSRISGAHCVDCPHWVALAPAEHEEFLRREWRAEPGSFTANRTIFLPEDFRLLRQWLHAAARGKTGSSAAP